MSTIQLAYNATTRVVTVQTNGDAVPGGSVALADFVHDEVTDVLGDGVNHVLYNHVRDALYAIGVLDMGYVSIVTNPVTAISAAPATVTLAAAASQQITTTFTPANASYRSLTYTTSDATKATVSASGLITAVATGTATITVTSTDGSFTDTVVVTVS